MIQEQRLVLIEDLVGDADNPNEMSEAQLQGLMQTIQTYGFLIPVITNKHLKIADGHQRVEAAKRLGFTHVSAIVLDIEEPDRLILQQVMNKLRGQHREDRDAKAFQKLFEAEKLSRLATLMAVKENRLLAVINKHQTDNLQGNLDEIYPPETICASLKEICGCLETTEYSAATARKSRVTKQYSGV